MAPDTMVAEVAQNTVSKMRKPSVGRPAAFLIETQVAEVGHADEAGAVRPEHKAKAHKPEQQ
jgi:hypothetical protein